MGQTTWARALLLERLRVERHLRGAEQLARRNARRLDPVRFRNRALLIDELARYRKAGRFPRNRDFKNAIVPYFVDSDGTRCALAHLLEISGHGELVHHIAGHRNHVRVAELSSNAELRAWLASSGLTLEEAARIQPTYCDVTRAQECFCGESRSDAMVVLGTVLRVESDGTLRVRIERIDGPLAVLSIGDEISARGSAGPGALALFRASPDGDGGTGTFFKVVHGIVTHESVTCTTDFGTEHPVPTDVAMAALRSSPTDCEALLVAQNPNWHLIDCDDSGCGCRVLPGSAAVPAFTALAVLSALLAYRRRRRARCVRL